MAPPAKGVRPTLLDRPLLVGMDERVDLSSRTKSAIGAGVIEPAVVEILQVARGRVDHPGDLRHRVDEQAKARFTLLQRLMELRAVERLRAEIGDRRHEAPFARVELPIGGKRQGEGADRAPFRLERKTGDRPVAARGMDGAMMGEAGEPLLPVAKDDRLAMADDRSH